MNNVMEYKSYQGTVEYSPEDDILFGKVLGIRSLISYHGQSVKELRKDFESAVDEYLALCAENGTNPEKSYRGCFNVRIDPTLHKEAYLIAQAHHISLNQFVETSVKNQIASFHGQ